MNPKELVVQKHPNAHADDDGERIQILVKRDITETCPHCGQPWTHTAPEFVQHCLGFGGTEEVAWKDAAYRLGLIPLM